MNVVLGEGAIVNVPETWRYPVAHGDDTDVVQIVGCRRRIRYSCEAQAAVIIPDRTPSLGRGFEVDLLRAGDIKTLFEASPSVISRDLNPIPIR